MIANGSVFRRRVSWIIAGRSHPSNQPISQSINQSINQYLPLWPSTWSFWLKGHLVRTKAHRTCYVLCEGVPRHLRTRGSFTCRGHMGTTEDDVLLGGPVYGPGYSEDTGITSVGGVARVYTMTSRTALAMGNKQLNAAIDQMTEYLADELSKLPNNPFKKPRRTLFGLGVEYAYEDAKAEETADSLSMKLKVQIGRLKELAEVDDTAHQACTDAALLTIQLGTMAGATSMSPAACSVRSQAAEGGQLWNRLKLMKRSNKVLLTTCGKNARQKPESKVLAAEKSKVLAAVDIVTTTTTMQEENPLPPVKNEKVEEQPNGAQSEKKRKAFHLSKKTAP